MDDDLRVVYHLSSDAFHDVDDIPMLEDDRHVYLPAINDDEKVEDTEYAPLADAVREGKVSPYVRNFYILNRSEPDYDARLRAVAAYH